MYESELELARKAAKAAGEFLREKRGIRVDVLEGKDIKLSSDKLSEKIIMDLLEPSGIPILSEEYGFKGQEGRVCWIVDPLDGTINYYKGFDEMACVSIALWADQMPVLGVVYRFMKEELFWGVSGFGAFLNGSPIKPSSVKTTKEAVMATGFPVKRDYDTESLGRYIRQVQRFKKVRMLGAAAIMGTFVACGRFDAYFEEGIMLWDVAAAAAIVSAAGGSVYLKMMDDNQCICRCFATTELEGDYDAQGL